MTLNMGEIIVLYLYLNYIVWGDILQILIFCTLISLNHDPPYLRKFLENVNPRVNYSPLLYLSKLYMSKGKIIKTKLVIRA